MTGATASHGAAPGSRARSREIGYAQAMYEIWEMAREIEKSHHQHTPGVAAYQADPENFAFHLGAGGAMRQLAEYAFDAWMLTSYPDDTHLRSAMYWWGERPAHAERAV